MMQTGLVTGSNVTRSGTAMSFGDLLITNGINDDSIELLRANLQNSKYLQGVPIKLS